MLTVRVIGLYFVVLYGQIQASAGEDLRLISSIRSSAKSVGKGRWGKARVVRVGVLAAVLVSAKFWGLQRGLQL